MGISAILCTGQGQDRSRKVTEGHFLLHGYATHDLGVIFHAGSDGHGYIYPQLTLLIISVYLKHKNRLYTIRYSVGTKKFHFQVFILYIKLRNY